MNDINFEIKHVAKVDEETLETIRETISCACCEKELVNVISIKKIPLVQKSQFKCPFCEKKSFIETFEHKVFFEPLEGLLIKDIEVTYNDKGDVELCLVNLQQKKVL